MSNPNLNNEGNSTYQLTHALDRLRPPNHFLRALESKLITSWLTFAIRRDLNKDMQGIITDIGLNQFTDILLLSLSFRYAFCAAFTMFLHCLSLSFSNESNRLIDFVHIYKARIGKKLGSLVGSLSIVSQLHSVDIRLYSIDVSNNQKG